MMAIKDYFQIVFGKNNYWLCFISIFFTCYLCRLYCNCRFDKMVVNL